MGARIRPRRSSGSRHADVAQLVERWLPKPKVAGSRPVVRFSTLRPRGVRGSSGSAEGGRLALDGGSHGRGARVRARLPGARAAARRPGRSRLSRGAVRARGLHDLERAVVRRPPHARVQRAVAAALLAGGAAGPARGLVCCLCRPVRVARASTLWRRTRTVRRALVRLRHRHAARHQPRAVRTWHGVRARGGGCAAARPAAAGGGARVSVAARQSGGWTVHGDRRTRLRLG